MPEGDTIFRACAVLHTALAGRPLLATDFRVPRFATTDLSGYQLNRVYPRGKHILMECQYGDRVAVIHSHLKMDGEWRLYGEGATFAANRAIPTRFDHTVRAVLSVPGTTAVGRLLGILDVLSPEEAESELSTLGPDLLGADWNSHTAKANLLARPQRRLGLALLDQRNLAGVGNVFRCEICFLARIHPFAPVKQSDLGRVIDLAYKLLQANKLRSVRSTIGGPARRGDSTWVYGRGKQPCRRCGTLIEKVEELGRPVYFCPRCQPEPPNPPQAA